MSLSELIPIVRHLRNRGVAVTVEVYHSKDEDGVARLIDITRFYNVPSEEDEERAAKHDSIGHDKRHVPRKLKVTFVAALGTRCGNEPCARVTADRLYRNLEARVESERQNGTYRDMDPDFSRRERRFINMMWEYGAPTPDVYLISLADSAAEWELKVEEAVDKGKERKARRL